jgi:hypothetical protein
MNDIDKITQMDIFDLSDEFVNVCFDSIEKLKNQMAETKSVFNLLQSKMSKEFSSIEEKIDDRNKAIFKHIEFDQEKYLKNLHKSIQKLEKVLVEDFNLLKFIGNLKVQEAMIVEGREK